MNQQEYDYRISHASKGYGQHYAKYYGKGTYPYCIWQMEKQILKDIFNKYITNPAKTAALDFATGTGRVLEFLSDQNLKHIYGVDISTDMLEVAKKIFHDNPSITFIQGDITQNKKLKQGIKNKDIKLITAFRFFLNAQPELREAVLEALKDVSDEFILIFNIHKIVPSFMSIQKALTQIKRVFKPVDNKYPVITLTQKYVKTLLNKHGYELIDQYPVAWTTDRMYPLFLKKCTLVQKLNKTFLRNIIPSEMIFVAQYKKSKNPK